MLTLVYALPVHLAGLDLTTIDTTDSDGVYDIAGITLMELVLVAGFCDAECDTLLIRMQHIRPALGIIECSNLAHSIMTGRDTDIPRGAATTAARGKQAVLAWKKIDAERSRGSGDGGGRRGSQPLFAVGLGFTKSKPAYLFLRAYCFLAKQLSGKTSEVAMAALRSDESLFVQIEGGDAYKGGKWAILVSGRPVILQRLSISPSLSFQKIGGRH